MGLVTGAREGSTRTSHDGHRARCGRLCRLSFIVPPTFPLWGFFWVLFLVSGWRVRVCPSSTSTCSDHLATVLILSREGSRARDTSWLGGGGGGRPEDSARTTVCLGSLGVVAVLCVESRESRVGSRESRVESRVTSPQPQSQSGHPTRANLVHIYDSQDMKKGSRTSVSGAQTR